MEIGSNETIKQAVTAGLGIAFISGHTIAAEIEDRRLVILDVVGLPAKRSLDLEEEEPPEMGNRGQGRPAVYMGGKPADLVY